MEPDSSLMWVQVWPGGIQVMPQGTTAGDIVRTMGYLEIGSSADATSQVGGAKERVVNVNNQLVPESTILNPGDLVVLSDAILKNV